MPFRRALSNISNASSGRPRRRLRGNTKTCPACRAHVPSTGDHWNSDRDLCVTCADQQPPNDNQTRLTVTIPAHVHKTCSLCRKDFLALAAPATVGSDVSSSATRCESCKKSERCSVCKCIKKWRHFRKSRNNNALFKSCQTCRSRAMDRNAQKRAQAEAAGMI